MRVRLATAALAAGALAATAGAAAPIGGPLLGDRISISHNGGLVAFQGKTDGDMGVFVLDTVTGASTRLSYKTVGGERQRANATRPSISADGSQVLVTSTGASGFTPRDQLWLIDRAGNASQLTTGLSQTPRDLNMAAGAGAAVFATSLAEPYHVRFGGTPRQIAQRGTYLSISGDGGRVAYWWDFDVFVWDAATGKTAVVSKDAAGREAQSATYPQISANGRYVSFAGWFSGQKQTHGKGNLSYTQAYRKDLRTGKLLQVSRDTKGRDAGENVTWTALSADGSRVLFLTAAKLTAEDRDASPDAYVKDVPSGDLIFVETGGSPTHLVLSGDGSTVAWSTGGRLFVQKLGGGEECAPDGARLLGSRSRVAADCLEIDKVRFPFTDQFDHDLGKLRGRANELKSVRERWKPKLEDARDRLLRETAAVLGLNTIIAGDSAKLEQLRKARCAAVCDKAAAAKAQRAFDGLESQVKEWQSQRRDAQWRLEDAASDFSIARGLVDEADRGLLAVAQPLATLDFELVGLSATVAGAYVFELEFDSPYDDLAALNKALTGTGEELERMRAKRKEAFREFVAAHKLATERATDLANAIWETERNKAVVKGGIFTLDILLAAAEGGVVGVTLELVKKAHEALYDAAADGVRDPEPDVDAWVRDALRDTVKTRTVVNTLVDRAYKATVVEASKDIVVERVLDTLVYEPLKNGEPARLAARAAGDDVAGLLGLGPRLGFDPAKVYEKVVGRRKHLDELGTFLDKYKAENAAGWSWQKVRGKLGKDVALELVKDFADKYAEAAAAARLEQASELYLGADAAARVLFAVYRATVLAQDKAEEAHLKLLNEKARLIATWDPDTKQRVRTDKTFARSGELKIRLAIRRADPSADTKRFPLKVFVSGKEARRSRSSEQYEYVIAASALPDDTNKLTIEVR